MAAASGAPPRLVLVSARDPWPPRRGDQLRALQLVSALASEWRVTWLAPATGRGSAAERPELDRNVSLLRYRRTLLDRVAGVLRAGLSGEPLQTGLYASRDLSRRLAAESRGASLVVLQLARSAGALRALSAPHGPGAPRVAVDFIDSLALAFERRALVDALNRRPFLRFEAKRLARAESALLQRVSSAAVVCARDRDAILAREPHDPAREQKLAVVPLAVEPPAGAASVNRGRDERPVIALTGNLGYFVNRDAVLHFLDEVWPELRRARPELRLVIAGARSGAVAGRVRRAGAELVADPPDLRAVVASASVAVAPLRCGAGVPIKVLEAWSVGTPVVASSWAAAGAAGAPDRDLLVADTPAEWVRQIGRLLDDVGLRARLAAAGRQLLGRDHAPARVAGAIRSWARAALGQPDAASWHATGMPGREGW